MPMSAALLISIALTSAALGVKPFAGIAAPVGYQPSMKYCLTIAAAPAAAGAAMLVPESCLYCVSSHTGHGAPSHPLTERISMPGAVRSGLIRSSLVGPRLEVLESTLLLIPFPELPTVITFLATA